MIELAPGLSYWLAPHPDWEEGDNWPREVPSFRFASSDGVVFIDPLAPPADERPDWILLTSPWHARDAARYPDARVWAPPDAVWNGPAPTTTAELPAGVEALLPEGDPNEALFYLREQRALITGDAFSGTDGRFHVFFGDQEREPFVHWLPSLLELPVDRVLVAHGPFVLQDAALVLRAAIGEATLEVLLEHASASDEVIGVYVFGSRGRPDGRADARSDWDVGAVLRDEAAKAEYERRWPFVHGAPVEIACATLDELRALDDYGTINVDLRLDKTGEIAAILRERKRVSGELARVSLDAYVNSTYRALRYRMVGVGIGARLDAAEAVSPLLTFLFALEGRVRPFNKYLETEPPDFPGMPDRLARVLDGDADELHSLFRDVERIARERGYADVIDAWEPDVAWLRGEARYREPE